MKQGLLLSIGMPRAGSGWHYNLIHDLVVAGGGKDAREIRRKYHLARLLTEVNCNIATLSPWRIIPAYLPVLLGNTYAIKTHAGPTAVVHMLIERDQVTPAYIYRDPRAAMLSALEYGQRASIKDRSNAFSHLKTLDEAAEFIQGYVKIWRAWIECDRVLAVRYEDLVENYNEECSRLVAFLGLERTNQAVWEILERYRPEQGDAGRRGTHFSKGQAERFRRVFTPEQLKAYTRVFEPTLVEMGYSP
jgi:hypothetical protein